MAKSWVEDEDYVWYERHEDGDEWEQRIIDGLRDRLCCGDDGLGIGVRCHIISERRGFCPSIRVELRRIPDDMPVVQVTLATMSIAVSGPDDGT